MALVVHRSAGLIYQNGPLSISANGSSAALSALQYERLGLFIAVLTAPTGTSPTLQFTVNGVDGQGNLFQLAQSASITAAGNSSLSIGSGETATLFVPQLVQVSWAVGGTTPVFPSVDITLYGR